MRARYAQQFNHPEYLRFREQVAILGTWDDHDYGWNNADGSYPIKTQTRDMALEFMEVPASDPRWLRAGLFGSYAFGPPGRRLRVVLIDDHILQHRQNRRSRTCWVSNNRPGWRRRCSVVKHRCT